MPQEPPNSNPNEIIDKISIIESLAEIYRREFTPESLQMMVDTLESVPVSVLREAAKIHIKTQQSFSIRSLMQIIDQGGLDGSREIVVTETWTQEEATNFLEQLDEVEGDE